MEDNTLDFNFWPSFSDLMLTLVLILVIVVFAVIAAFSVGTEEPTPSKPKPSEGEVIPPEVQQKQMDMIHAIAATAYGVLSKEVETNTFEIKRRTGVNRYTTIKIKNEPTLQRFSFSDRILFKPDKYNLSISGKETLQKVGNQIKEKLDNITEIQIQGHADPDKPTFEPSNLHLAAKRAITVFQFLQEKIDIDPAKHLMSATSFGEYKPVQRKNGDKTYTLEKLKEHNLTKELKDNNRRIDILLFYRNEKTDEQKSE